MTRIIYKSSYMSITRNRVRMQSDAYFTKDRIQHAVTHYDYIMQYIPIMVCNYLTTKAQQMILIIIFGLEMKDLKIVTAHLFKDLICQVSVYQAEKRVIQIHLHTVLGNTIRINEYNIS